MKALLVLLFISTQAMAQTSWVHVAERPNPDGTTATFFLESTAQCQGRNILKVRNLQTNYGNVNYLTAVEVFAPMTKLPYPFPSITDGPSSPLYDLQGNIVANGYVSQNPTNPSEPLLAFPDTLGYTIYKFLCE